jgi:hypothetical protein
MANNMNDAKPISAAAGGTSRQQAQAEQGSDQGQGAREALNTSVMTVSSRYRYENQNSVYFLMPQSSDIYLLDFKLQGFCKELLKWKRGPSLLPSSFTSQQTLDANIFVVGGYRSSSSSSAEINVLRDTLMIDANLSVYEREPMKTARFGAPLALVRDRFVLALGG